ncbi:MAG: NAD(+) synthase [Longimicrobiales bacterium]
MTHPFHNLYTHGFARVAVCVPLPALSRPAENVRRTLELAERASDAGAVVALFPELGLTGYSNEDLFHQDALLDAARAAITRIARESASLRPLLAVGAPLRVQGRLYNCAVLIHDGRVLGAVPKSYLPNYREFYEKRQFTAGLNGVPATLELDGEAVPFGADLVFDAEGVAGLSVHAEICEDLWAPIPPSTYAALAGATVLLNLSASNITIAKADYRRDLCASQSGRCIAAYLYAAAGPGESTTDLAWDGHALVYENDELLAESERFATEPQLVLADVDLERLAQDRMRMTSFNDAAGEHARPVRRIAFAPGVPAGELATIRRIERFPYVPSDPDALDQRCFEAYNIQVQGLAQRMRAAGIDKAVIGVSGGLDSTQALLVTARAMDLLGLPRANVLAYTMPGFGTTERTLDSARTLMDALQVTATELDIRDAARQMLEDIGHPFGRGEAVHDVTFENVQAGERTAHLFRLANLHGGLVVGTGDLSELALGWTTYGVGDHMSHYNVNASVPKTLIQHLVRWSAERGGFDERTAAVLRDVVASEISPELVPPGSEADEETAQPTEDVVGPYDLQDFHTYFITRYGFRPSKVAFLAHAAWGDVARGDWPPLYPDARRRAYDLPIIKHWLRVFLERFFRSQFKRSVAPTAPKVGSGGSLSPRADWRAPADAPADVWIDELERGVP